ncbi:MAG TPA: SDR family oxidoreductase [Acidimicrobiales bacterium]|jgi:NAD(P)-dependent dehydrogenase (short-subunit alcohol dehydrogenase family)|nr:SDR family oxidoreductase [Acidimicrobiales bacterium]
MRVLITGAARAIGEATAKELTARGHDVVATARDVSLLEPVEASLRLELDVRDEASVRRALDACGELDAIVNNAGISSKGPLEDYPLQRLHDAFDTNAIGPLRLLQPVLPSWRERGSGVIVNVSSVQGRIPTPLEGAYAASKHALEAISETLHYELGHFGIRVVIVEPGYVAPGMKDAGGHPGPDVYGDLWEQWDSVSSTLTGPTGRSDPSIVATAIADALDDPGTPLRVEVGTDAETVLAVRRQLDDASFEATMRETLGLTW